MKYCDFEPLGRNHTLIMKKEEIKKLLEIAESANEPIKKDLKKVVEDMEKELDFFNNPEDSFYKPKNPF